MNVEHEAFLTWVTGQHSEVWPDTPQGSAIAAIHAANVSHGLGLLYRGSPERQGLLRPKVVYWQQGGRLVADTRRPATYATANPAIACFMALAPAGRKPYSFTAAEDGSVQFEVFSDAKERFVSAVGHVALLEPESFHPLDLDGPASHEAVAHPVVGHVPEFRSHEVQIPLYNVTVAYSDFEELLDLQAGSGLQYIES